MSRIFSSCPKALLSITLESTDLFLKAFFTRLNKYVSNYTFSPFIENFPNLELFQWVELQFAHLN